MNDNAKTIYKENCIVFGKVLCRSCGKDHDLIYIEKLTHDRKDQWEDIICQECWEDLPSYEGNDND
jgi:hypothetical protein